MNGLLKELANVYKQIEIYKHDISILKLKQSIDDGQGKINNANNLLKTLDMTIEKLR